MSRVAILSDVHGNSSALDAALNEIDTREHVERIYCLGDIIGLGPYSNEVLSMLFSREDVTMILGNHDHAILSLIHGEPYTGDLYEREHHKWLAERLDPVLAAALSDIPNEATERYGNLKFRFIHYHSNRSGDFLPVDWNPSACKLEKIYKNEAADVICYGHHHSESVIETPRRLYVNPGSLGCSADRVAKYAVLQISEDDLVEVHLQSVSYDFENYSQSFDMLEVPGRRYILDVFYNVHKMYKM